MINYGKYQLYINLAILAIVVMAVYYVYNLFFKKSPGDQTEDESKKEIKQNQLSYDKSQFAAFADKLEAAFTWSWGTNEKAVYDVFAAMETKSDVLQLIVSHGSRYYTQLAVWPTKMNLPEIMNYELNSEEIGEVNAILRQKGIDYTF